MVSESLPFYQRNTVGVRKSLWDKSVGWKLKQDLKLSTGRIFSLFKKISVLLFQMRPFQIIENNLLYLNHLNTNINHIYKTPSEQYLNQCLIELFGLGKYIGHRYCFLAKLTKLIIPPSFFTCYHFTSFACIISFFFSLIPLFPPHFTKFFEVICKYDAF